MKCSLQDLVYQLHEYKMNYSETIVSNLEDTRM